MSESAGSWRRRVVVLGVVAILASGAVVGAWVGAQDDAGDTGVDTYAMAGEGMEPTLRHGDRVTARNIEGSDVDRGDVVVIEVPTPAGGSGPTRVVKRVIAVAGDKIEATPAGEVLINGETVDEPYLAPSTVTSGLVRQEVPAGHVFVMGDNRSNSTDSRVYGPIANQEITALVESA